MVEGVVEMDFCPPEVAIAQREMEGQEMPSTGVVGPLACAPTAYFCTQEDLSASSVSRAMGDEAAHVEPTLFEAVTTARTVCVEVGLAEGTV